VVSDQVRGLTDRQGRRCTVRGCGYGDGDNGIAK
jgi:hypothetical protein